MENLYHTDYYRWVKQQKEHLKNREFDRLDLDNLIEEVEDMGKSEPRTIKSHTTNLLLHLLKYDYQTRVINPVLPEPYNCRDWLGSMDRARSGVRDVLSENPSLNQRAPDLLTESYPEAKRLAIKEMNRYVQPHQMLDESSYPAECPWSFEQIMKEDWLP